MGSSGLPPNQQLLQAREDRQWSRERVAVALNLTAFTIKILEEGRYNELHGTAYVVGYMRAYAELFELDADILVAEYHAQLAENQAVQADNVSTLDLHRKKQQRARMGVAAAVCLVAGMGLLTANHSDAPVAPDTTGIAVQTAVGTTVINSLDELPDENPTQGMLPQVVWEQTVSEGQVDEILKQRILGDAHQSIADVVASSSLSFQFSADCWVEVFDGDQQLIYSSLQKAQETLELSGKPPFRITLGYAPGVSLSYNGQPVNIDANNANIAKLVLGNS